MSAYKSEILKDAIDPVLNQTYFADTPDDFVDSLIRLQQPDKQKEFVNNSRKMVENYYSVNVLRENRLEIYNNILNKTNDCSK